MEDAKMYAQRNQKGSGWFSHDSDKPAAPAASKAAPTPTQTTQGENNGVANADTGRAQLIKPKCDSNDWFKHDNKDVPVKPVAASSASNEDIKTVDVPAGGSRKADTTPVVEPLVAALQAINLEPDNHKAAIPAADKKDDIQAAGAATKRDSNDGRFSRDGRESREGTSNGRRDKMGSSADWFSHDHVVKEVAGAEGITARVTTVEGDHNASRMRGESENWFSYDAKKADTSSAKADASSAKPDQQPPRGRINPQQNDDMHHIFHMGK